METNTLNVSSPQHEMQNLLHFACMIHSSDNACLDLRNSYLIV